MPDHKSTLPNAESFLAMDVVSYLGIFIIITFVIINLDKFVFDKTPENIAQKKQPKTWRNWLYFLLFGRFNKKEKYKNRPFLARLSYEFFPVLLLVFVIRGFIAEPFRVPTNSMMPTILAGDFIFVNKMSYGVRLPITNTKIIGVSEVKRGDIVVFRYPNYERDKTYSGADFIKRVIGLPGDKIEYVKDSLTINGVKIQHKKLDNYFSNKESAKNEQGWEIISETIGDNNYEILNHNLYYSKDFSGVVPNNHYFVMGDNRANSEDSRFWGFVPDQYLLGKANFIWFNYDKGINLDRIGGI